MKDAKPKDNKLMDLLKTLSPDEFKKLGGFLEMSSNKNCKILYGKIYKYSKRGKDFESKKLNEQKIYSEIFERRVYNQKKWSNLKTALTKEVENFYVYLDVIDNQETLRKEYLTLESLKKRELDKYYIGNYESMVKKKWSPNIEVDDYYHRYILKENFHFNDFERYEYEKKKIEHSASLEDVWSQLDVYTSLNQLRYCCLLLNGAEIESIDSEPVVVTAHYLLKTIPSKTFSHLPLIEVYYKTLFMIMHEDKDNYFKELRDCLGKLNVPNDYSNEKVVSKDELLIAYTILENYRIKRSRKGIGSTIEEICEVYDEMSAKDLFVKNGKVTGYRYVKNAVTVGAKAGRFEWAEDFIEKLGNKVRSDLKERVQNFNKGIICFYKGEYKKSLDFISDVYQNKYIDDYYKIECEILCLKCYYEQEGVDQFYGTQNKLAKRVKSQKLFSEKVVESYTKFVNLLGRLEKYRDEVNKTKQLANFKRLVREISEAEFISNKQWLLRKLEEVKKMYGIGN